MILITAMLISFGDFANDIIDTEHYDSKLNIITNVEALDAFYNQLDSLILEMATSAIPANSSKRKVSIVHFGDSHIQADFLSGRVRLRFQDAFGNGGRGFVFPYQVAHSNGPSDVRIDYRGNWAYKSILRDYEGAQIGLSGTVLTCSDSSLLSISTRVNKIRTQSFNKITIFEKNGYFYPEDSTLSVSMSGIKTSSTLNYSRFLFKNDQDSIMLRARTANNMQLHGIVLENRYPGILYHAMGSNGASTLQFLRSSQFEDEIKALSPSLVIISFGTNDAYLSTSRFCSSCVKDRYKRIIQRIRSKSPNACILITSPPDHYYRRRYDNRNLYYLNKALHELCKEQNVALWDLYSIMGGAKSIMSWQRAGLARGDLIHFSREGYRLQGDMLYEALINGYEAKEK